MGKLGEMKAKLTHIYKIERHSLSKAVTKRQNK